MKYLSTSFGQRSYKTVILITSGLIILVFGGVFLYKFKLQKPSNHLDQSNQKTINDVTTEQLPKEIVTEKPITGPFTTQISQGQQHLLANLDRVAPFERLFLDYLQRKFSLSSQFNGLTNQINPPVKGDGEDPLQFKVFRRIAYPEKLIDKLPASDQDPLARMIMEAAYCDRIPVSSDFDKLIQSNIDAGGYNLTHVEFSLHLMQDNRCSYFSSNQTEQIRDKIAPLIAAIVNNSDTKPDLRYEAVAYLLDMGRQDLIKEVWIKQITSEQQLDGSWDLEKGVKDANGHTTILAIWALLEYSHSDLQYQPMIRHP